MLGVVIPTLNAERFLRECLGSIERAGVAMSNVVVVDSGSTDGTIRIAREAGCGVCTEKPGNLYAAVNVGMERLTPEWVTYLAADDLWLDRGPGQLIPEAIAAGCDVAVSSALRFRPDGRVCGATLAPDAGDISVLLSSGVMPFAQAASCFRREAWRRVGGFSTDTRLISDLRFFRSLSQMKAGFLVRRDVVAAGFRVHPQQLSQSQSAAMRREWKNLDPRKTTAGSFVAALRWRVGNRYAAARFWGRSIL